MYLICQILLLGIMLKPISSHMEMIKPLCRRSRFDRSQAWFQIDYTNMFPMGTPAKQEYPYPCHGNPVGNITDTIFAGTEFVSRIAGDISHNGGHCEWSISYDGINFVVVKTIIGECLTQGMRQYHIPLPSTAPPGQAIVAWTWVNRTGLREYYMNCADVIIESNYTSSVIEGPAPVIANLPGYPVIPQFSNTVLGQELYVGRPNLTIPVQKPLVLSVSTTEISTSTIEPSIPAITPPTPTADLSAAMLDTSALTVESSVPMTVSSALTIETSAPTLDSSAITTDPSVLTIEPAIQPVEPSEPIIEPPLTPNLENNFDVNRKMPLSFSLFNVSRRSYNFK